MPEPILLLLALLVAGVVVLRPVWRQPAPGLPGDDDREAAMGRHRVALETLRDVETDRRAGSLDDAGYAQAIAEAEARAVATRAALDEPTAEVARPGRAPVAGPLAAAGIIGALLLGASLVPAAGVANRTEINEGLAAAQEAESARQERISDLTRALAADPEDAEVLSDLADAYLSGSTPRDLAAAAAALQLLISLEPDRADAYERIVSAYIRADDFANARAALDSYEGRESADPAEVAFLDGLIALRGENDPERAAAAFDRFLELAPDDPRAGMIRSLRAETESAP
jgi:cytochrome c-type biogenesis protein CcmI